MTAAEQKKLIAHAQRGNRAEAERLHAQEAILEVWAALPRRVRQTLLREWRKKSELFPLDFEVVRDSAMTNADGMHLANFGHSLVPGQAEAIHISRRLLRGPRSELLRVLAHEFGHGFMFATGHPKHTEGDADALALHWGFPP